jgi:hypothetical protein
LEFNVDRHVKTYWDKFINLIDRDEQKFSDATSENSVRTSKFLKGLDLDPIMPELNKHTLFPKIKSIIQEGLCSKL